MLLKYREIETLKDYKKYSLKSLDRLIHHFKSLSQGCSINGNNMKELKQLYSELFDHIMAGMKMNKNENFELFLNYEIINKNPELLDIMKVKPDHSIFSKVTLMTKLAGMLKNYLNGTELKNTQIKEFYLTSPNQATIFDKYIHFQEKISDILNSPLQFDSKDLNKKNLSQNQEKKHLNKWSSFISSRFQNKENTQTENILKNPHDRIESYNFNPYLKDEKEFDLDDQILYRFPVYAFNSDYLKVLIQSIYYYMNTQRQYYFEIKRIINNEIIPLNWINCDDREELTDTNQFLKTTASGPFEQAVLSINTNKDNLEKFKTLNNKSQNFNLLKVNPTELYSQRSLNHNKVENRFITNTTTKDSKDSKPSNIIESIKLLQMENKLSTLENLLVKKIRTSSLNHLFEISKLLGKQQDFLRKIIYKETIKKLKNAISIWVKRNTKYTKYFQKKELKKKIQLKLKGFKGLQELKTKMNENQNLAKEFRKRTSELLFFKRFKQASKLHKSKMNMIIWRFKKLNCLKRWKALLILRNANNKVMNKFNHKNLYCSDSNEIHKSTKCDSGIDQEDKNVFLSLPESDLIMATDRSANKLKYEILKKHQLDNKAYTVFKHTSNDLQKDLQKLKSPSVQNLLCQKPPKYNQSNRHSCRKESIKSCVKELSNGHSNCLKHSSRERAEINPSGKSQIYNIFKSCIVCKDKFKNPFSGQSSLFTHNYLHTTVSFASKC